MDNKQLRLIVALGLSLLFLVVYQKYLAPKIDPLPPKAVVAENQVKAAAKENLKKNKSSEQDKQKPAGNSIKKNLQTSSNKNQQKKINAATLQFKANAKQEFKTLTSDRFFLKLDSKGARIAKIYLRNYKYKDRSFDFRKGAKVETIEVDGKKEQALEVSEGQGMDFQVFLKKTEIISPAFNKVNFIVLSSDDKKVSFALDFDFKGSSLRLTKTYTIIPFENYFVFKTKIENLSNGEVTFGNDEGQFFLSHMHRLGPFPKIKGKVNPKGNQAIPSWDAQNYYNFVYVDESLEKFTSASAQGSMMCSPPAPPARAFQTLFSKKVDYIGSSSKYFISTVSALSEPSDGYLKFTDPSELSRVAFGYKAKSLKAAKTESSFFTKKYAVYLGIREMEERHLNNPSLAKGMLAGLDEDKVKKSFDINSVIAPFRDGILSIIRVMYKVIPNYGLVIILFAFLFKAVFFPLNQKQAVSMKKMKDIQPLMQEINKKYAKNPKVKNAKVMELYKKHKVNPVSGCLPILIQMPIFIALYGAFGTSVELWEAQFFPVWITDLSKPDTVATFTAMGNNINLNLLPLIMTVSQILQAKFTTVSGDATQQKMMMYFMPLMMLFFFWSMPSGLTLYWTVTNFLSIAQQYYTNKKLAAA